MDIESIATSVVNVLAPFMPFLIETGKEGVKKMAEKFAEKGGETAWARVQEIWRRINAHIKDDSKFKGAALMLSAEPTDESSKKILADVLIARLRVNPQLAQELREFLCKQEAIQEIIADQKSKVSDVTQQNSGNGKQSIKASRNSQINGVKQITK
jgi:hypothetical protein